MGISCRMLGLLQPRLALRLVAIQNCLYRFVKVLPVFYHVPMTICPPALLFVALTLHAQSIPPKPLLEKMDKLAPHFGQLSRIIWEAAEVGYKEHKSSALLKEELRKNGFRIEENIAGIPTAFTATYGEGQPVIGILGEYDALPGLSQSDKPEKQPVTAGAPGHGCGHNLLGAASTFAAVTIKEYLQESRRRGTIKFFGTPAEEGGGGKIYMIRAGAFKNVDAVLAWHPSDENGASLKTSQANIAARFRFHGKAAHAAIAPEMGRSALDGLLLFSHAIELMREHVPEATRIHYVITKGGDAPNIVPDIAESYLYLRYPGMVILDGIWTRILKAAEGAAMATETKFELELVNSVYNTLPNDTLAALADKQLHRLGGIRYTPEETRFAEQLRKSLTGDLPPIDNAMSIAKPENGHGNNSTDLADVSWTVPTTEVSIATNVPGAPLHSWQSTACAGSSIGRQGMVLAAKTLTLMAINLYETPAQLEAARKDFDKRRAGHAYRSRLPQDAKPPLTYRDK